MFPSKTIVYKVYYIFEVYGVIKNLSRNVLKIYGVELCRLQLWF